MSSFAKLKTSAKEEVSSVKKSISKPPPLKGCKKCYDNIGDDKTGLCATCDPDYWKKRINVETTEWKTEQ